MKTTTFNDEEIGDVQYLTANTKHGMWFLKKENSINPMSFTFPSKGVRSSLWRVAEKSQ